ncbi:hypothetical protein [Methylobacterium nigriterrae]|uniref:hypothetical protein n=1 Tax=Methylobacterium nigriterrae TaxID=3127512 RepID=UPI0030132B2F
MVWASIIGGILAVSLLSAIVFTFRRRRSRRGKGEPSLAQAAREFAKLRYLGPSRYRRRG